MASYLFFLHSALTIVLFCISSQPAGLKRAGSPSETEKASKKARVDDKEITVCYICW